MATYNIPQVTLVSSKEKMPVLGLGTATFPPVDSKIVVQAVLDAIELGYRHFDTAAVYKSEYSLGDAIAEALRLGLIKSREELFITSKLWCSDAHADRVLPALKTSLKNLKLEHLDLYLIHWPISSKPGECMYPLNKEDMLEMDIKSVWEAMEECQTLGLTKSIGVSNFSCKKTADVLSFAKIVPAVNQVELNPLWQQKKLVKYCKENGILVTAFSPLGAAGTSWGSNKVMENEVLKEIAKAKGKSVAQVCLRWGYEQGIGVVMKSYNKERLEQNIQIFDWELTEQDSIKIAQLPQNRVHRAEEFVDPNGPIKSVEELWDGEL
jgi:diketogulonate reductase-like aldo/keto reductase